MKKYLGLTITAFLFIHFSIIAQIPTEGLVACYPFNLKGDDMSGNNYHGTVNGATLTTDRFDSLNAAFSFNGSSNYISIPFSPFNLPDYSYSVWVKIKSYPAANETAIIIDIGSYNGCQTISLSNIYGSGFIGWGFNNYNSSGNAYRWAQGFLPPLDTWFHLALTRNGSFIKFYINGKLVNSQPTNGTTSYYGSGQRLANIGRRAQMTLEQFFDGDIDDIHIYNRALTEEEVIILYKGGPNKVVLIYPFPLMTCDSLSATFRAMLVGTFNNPSYQWKVSGRNVGTNSPIYHANSLFVGNTIWCTVFSEPCEQKYNSDTACVIGATSPLMVNIAVSPDTISCIGDQLVFYAMGFNGGPEAVYQWKINGIKVGTNSNTLVVDTLSDGAIVSCTYSTNASNLQCLGNNPAESNRIKMTIKSSYILDISITAIPDTKICNDGAINCKAIGINGGKNAIYRWKLNGMSVGSNSDTISFTNIKNNDIIYCLYTSPLSCALNNPDTSNFIRMEVYESPMVDAGENIELELPESYTMNPLYNGGTPPYQFNWFPADYLSNPYIPNPSAKPEETTTYTLVITDVNDCIAVDSITIFVDTENNIFIPNTFSPNGDNQNDVLYVRGMGLASMSFFIFDRLGEIVFYSYSLDEGWDGSFKGKKLNPGVFAYFFKGKTYDNKTIIKKGNITLLK